MAAAARPDAALSDQPPDQVTQPFQAEPLTVFGQEQHVTFRDACQLWAGRLLILPDPVSRPFTYRYQPVFASFALPYHLRALLVVDAVNDQPRQLSAAHAGAVKHLQHRTVPQPFRRGDVRPVQQGFSLTDAQHVFRQALSLMR